MSRKNSTDLVVLSSKMPRALAEAVQELADRHHTTVSGMIGRLLLQALEDAGAVKRVERDLSDEGYQAGLRRGLHEVYEHLKQLGRGR